MLGVGEVGAVVVGVCAVVGGVVVDAAATAAVVC